jgi:hypothetical protein
MGRKPKANSKEFDIIQKLKHDVQALRRENSRLKKELDRVDISKYEHLAELVQMQAFEDLQVANKSKKQKLMETWECHECKNGHLRIHIIQRLDGIFYFRKCSNCEHKTRLQKYTESVKGIRNEK